MRANGIPHGDQDQAGCCGLPMWRRSAEPGRGATGPVGGCGRQLSTGRVGYTTAPGAGVSRGSKCPGGGVNMDPGEYSKRGLSDRLSDLLSQTIDVQPPPPFLVQDLRTFPSHFQSRALDPLVVNQLSELLRDIWEILGLEIFERSPFSRPFRSQ